MSTFDFVRPSGVWGPEMVPGASDYYGWDWRQARIISGDTGGVWAPLKPIVIGGAGLQNTSPGSQLAGGVRTKLGGRIQLGPQDIPLLFPARTVTRTIDFLRFHPQNVGFFGTLFPAPSFGSTGQGYLVAPDVYLRSVDPVPGSQPGGLVVGPIGSGAFALLSFSIPNEELINGAAVPGPLGGPLITNGAPLLSVTLNFRFLFRPTALPASLLRLSVASGSSPATLGPTGPYAVPGGLNTWAGGTVHAVPYYVLPQANRTAPLSYFRNLRGLTTGATEPVWNTTPGSTTTDAFEQWLCIGPSGDLYATRLEQYFNNGNPQSISVAFDTPFNQSLDASSNFFQVTLSNVPNDGSLMLHSMQFTFGGITQMIWT